MTKFLLVAFSFLAFNRAFATGACSAAVACQNGSASCSAASRTTGDADKQFVAFCGVMNGGEKFRSCWIRFSNARVEVSDRICCDRAGNAIHAGWSTGQQPDASACTGI